MSFKDHFSEKSSGYQQYRPDYPPAMFSYLASLCSTRQMAWDCATGTGQAARMLADHFTQVIATDASEAQISNARGKAGVDFRVATAEKSGIKPHSVNLITVAQALHWFDIDAFAKEAERVLQKEGIVAAWTYNLLHVSPEIDECVRNLYETILGEYWPKERGMVHNGYRDIQLPFEALDAPQFEMSAQWSLSQLVGYLGTWSAAKRYHKEQGHQPVEQLTARIVVAWGEAPRREINWPLSVRIWKK